MAISLGILTQHFQLPTHMWVMMKSWYLSHLRLSFRSWAASETPILKWVREIFESDSWQSPLFSMVYIEIHRGFSHMSIFSWLGSGKKQLHLKPCRLDMRISCQNWPQKNKSVSFSAISSPQHTRNTPGTEKWIELMFIYVYFITRDFQTFFNSPKKWSLPSIFGTTLQWQLAAIKKPGPWPFQRSLAGDFALGASYIFRQLAGGCLRIYISIKIIKMLGVIFSILICIWLIMVFWWSSNYRNVVLMWCWIIRIGDFFMILQLDVGDFHGGNPPVSSFCIGT